MAKDRRDEVGFSFKVNKAEDGIEEAAQEQRKQGERAGKGVERMSWIEVQDMLVKNADGGTVRADTIPRQCVDKLHSSSQPKTKKLPNLLARRFYLKVKEEHVPWKAKYNNIPRALLQRLKVILDNMVEMGIIAWQDTPYTCPINLVLKVNDDGETVIDRLVVDARELNANIEVEAPHVPLMETLFRVADGSYYYSTLDSVKSFWQLGVYGPHTKYMGIQTEWGTAVFLKMMFGVATAPSQMQKLMEEILGSELYQTCVVFIDDTLIYTKKIEGESEEEGMKRHMADVTRVVTKLADAGVTISVEKSRLFRHEVSYLGFLLGRNGLSVEKQKQAKVVDAAFPDTQKKLHTLLGAAAFLSKCLNCNLSSLTAPLRPFVRMEGRKYKLDYDPDDPIVRAAVTALKERIGSAVTLRPTDYERDFHIFTDGASSGVGYALCQYYEGVPPWGVQGGDTACGEIDQAEDAELAKGRPLPPKGKGEGYYVPICFASKSLNASHVNWDTREVEVYGIICALKKFEPWCLGAKKVVIHSDHRNAAYLRKYKDRFQKLGRWAIYLSMFNYEFEFCEGVRNGLADYMSRSPLPDPSLPFHGEDERFTLSAADFGSVQANEGRRWTVFCVCAGIASFLQAAERGELPIDCLGWCESDDVAAEVVEQAYPGVRRHEDMRILVHQLEQGKLVLKPDILEMTVPCQQNSRARQLAAWADEEHPQARLFALQAKLVELMEPKIVVMENVPPNVSTTQWRNVEKYDSVCTAIEKLGYTVTTTLARSSRYEHKGERDGTGRVRWIAVCTKKPLPGFEFPAGDDNFRGFGHMLDPESSLAVQRAKRCDIDGDGWVRFGGDGSRRQGKRHMCRQVGRVLPRDEKEEQVNKSSDDLESNGNRLGFRVYDVDFAMCTIRSSSKPHIVGPGGATQFIRDERDGVRSIRKVTPNEGPRLHSVVPRVAAHLSVLREKDVWRLLGGMVTIIMYLVLVVAPAVAFLDEHCMADEVVEVAAVTRSGATATETPGTPGTAVGGDSPRSAVRTGNVDMRTPVTGETEVGGRSPVADGSVRKKLEFGEGAAATGLPPVVDGVLVKALAWKDRVMPTAADIVLEQRNDVELGSIRRQLGMSKQTLLRCEGIDEKRLRELLNYHLDEVTDILYWTEGMDIKSREVRDSVRKIVVPKSGDLRTILVYLHHFSDWGAHSSRDQMVVNIRSQGFWWKNMKNSCDQAVARCVWCLQSKRAQQARQGLFTLRRWWAPFQCVSVDLQDFGKGKATAMGNRYLMVVMCEFSRWVQLFPLKAKEAQLVANAIVYGWMKTWGVMECLLMDPGREFDNHVLRLVCKMVGVRRLFTAAGQKNANARNERVHRVINELLKVYCAMDGNVFDWDSERKLAIVEWKLRSSTVQSTGFSPYQVVMGRTGRWPMDASVLNEAKQFPSARTYVQELHEALTVIWRQVGRAEVIAHARRSAEMNRGRRDVTYGVGDYVMVYSALRVLGGNRKLLVNWVGPFRVEEVRAGKKYLVMHIDTGKAGEYAVERLSPAATEWCEGEYDRRYIEGSKMAKELSKDLEEGDFALFQTEHGVFPAKVLEEQADGSMLVQWYNCASGRATVGGAYKPSWYDEKSGKEFFDDKERGLPTWNVQSRGTVASKPFNWNLSKGGRHLPAAVALQMFPPSRVGSGF
jgi:site-specific DNA-cytosine methylase